MEFIYRNMDNEKERTNVCEGNKKAKKSFSNVIFYISGEREENVC